MDNREAQAQWAQMLPRLKELVADNHSSRAIAGILNKEFGTMLSRNAVIGKRAREFGRGMPVTMRKKAPPLPTQPLVEPIIRGVHIMNLGPYHCRYMEGPAASLLYCGEVTALGVSWCPKHVEVVYGKSNVRS